MKKIICGATCLSALVAYFGGCIGADCLAAA